MLGRLLNYLLTPVLVRVFTEAEFGINTELYAYVSFFIIMFTYGMETAYFRFANSSHDKKTIFNTSMLSLIGTSILLSGLLIFFSQPLADSIHYHDHPEYITWFALILGI